jgi:hypothetical protein
VLASVFRLSLLLTGSAQRVDRTAHPLFEPRLPDGMAFPMAPKSKAAAAPSSVAARWADQKDDGFIPSKEIFVQQPEVVSSIPLGSRSSARDWVRNRPLRTVRSCVLAF